MPPKQASGLTQLRETAKLRRVMKGSNAIRFWWTIHGQTEMTNDLIGMTDIDRLCRTGTVTWIEWKQDELWHVEGTDLDGRSIKAVIALIEEEAETVIKVVTAMTL